MHTSIRFGVIAAFLCETWLSAAQRTITAKEATDLVDAMLTADGWNELPGFRLYEAPFGPGYKGYFFVHAEHDNPGGGSAIGHYAVEQTTGEVWDWAICLRFTSRALTQAQALLRRRIGLTDAEYRRIRMPGPFCESGQKGPVREMGKPSAKPPPVRIAGQVTDRAHRPIVDARVVLRAGVSRETITKTATDENGRFTFPAEPSGGYDLHFESPRFLPMDMSIAAVNDRDASVVMESAPIWDLARLSYGLCGSDELQPSCSTFGLVISAAAMVPICVLTILGMLLFRKRLTPILKASAVLLSAAVLCFFVPMAYIGLFANKLGGAVILMMAFPLIVILLFGGIGCFVVWVMQAAIGTVSKRLS
jgi:hypothetical protein